MCLWNCENDVIQFMKVKTSIKKKDKNDQIVRRKGRLYLINKTNPRRKMRQK